MRFAIADKANLCNIPLDNWRAHVIAYRRPPAPTSPRGRRPLVTDRYVLLSCFAKLSLVCFNFALFLQVASCTCHCLPANILLYCWPNLCSSVSHICWPTVCFPRVYVCAKLMCGWRRLKKNIYIKMLSRVIINVRRESRYVQSRIESMSVRKKRSIIRREITKRCPTWQLLATLHLPMHTWVIGFEYCKISNHDPNNHAKNVIGSMTCWITSRHVHQHYSHIEQPMSVDEHHANTVPRCKRALSASGRPKITGRCPTFFICECWWKFATEKQIFFPFWYHHRVQHVRITRPSCLEIGRIRKFQPSYRRVKFHAAAQGTGAAYHAATTVLAECGWRASKPSARSGHRRRVTPINECRTRANGREQKKKEAGARKTHRRRLQFGKLPHSP